MDGEFHEYLRSNGYYNIVDLGNGNWIGLFRFMFTTAIIKGKVGRAGRAGYDDRWCYDTAEEAIIAIHNWNGIDGEPEGWKRHPATGRRREKDGTEYINP